jgi:hypothetical protein
VANVWFNLNSTMWEMPHIFNFSRNLKLRGVGGGVGEIERGGGGAGDVTRLGFGPLNVMDSCYQARVGQVPVTNQFNRSFKVTYIFY